MQQSMSLIRAHTKMTRECSNLNYNETVKKLNTLQSNASIIEAVRLNRAAMNSKSLPEMRYFWKKMGYSVIDLKNLNIVHITGSKGKGSTAAFVDSLLRAYDGHQIKTGVFTSPHLINVRERIRIDGKIQSEMSFVNRFHQVWDLLKGENSPNEMPTYFRFLTLMAMHTFVQEKVDVAIIEAGVGGEYDATNFVEDPIVCAISSLGLEHQTILGNTLEEIAWNKAGIWKRNAVALASNPHVPSLIKIMQDRSEERQVASFRLVSRNENLEPSMLGLAGDFQVSNASLSLEVVSSWLLAMFGYKLDTLKSSKEWPSFVLKGLKNAYWPGRAQTFLETLGNNEIRWYLDGAHTVESLKECLKWFSACSSQESEKILVFSCTGNRDVEALLQQLQRGHFDMAIFSSWQVKTSNDDSVSLNEAKIKSEQALLEMSSIFKAVSPSCRNIKVFVDLAEAYDFIHETAEKNNSHLSVLVTGSIYLVGSILSKLSYNVE